MNQFDIMNVVVPSPFQEVAVAVPINKVKNIFRPGVFVANVMFECFVGEGFTDDRLVCSCERFAVTKYLCFDTIHKGHVGVVNLGKWDVGVGQVMSINIELRGKGQVLILFIIVLVTLDVRELGTEESVVGLKKNIVCKQVLQFKNLIQNFDSASGVGEYKIICFPQHQTSSTSYL